MTHGALQGQRILIIGGARRLGRAFALAASQAGADVAITTRTRDEEALRTVAECRSHGVRAEVFLCDLLQPDSITGAVESAVESLGGLDTLVNNAGLFEASALEDLTAEQWDSLYATNTRGPFLTAKAALPHLRNVTSGRIVNVGSLGGMRPWVTHAHYCSSKAALHMLTGTMAKAWAPEISVNCIAPGMIRFPGEPERLAAKTPMQRDGTPEDVVATLLFLLSAPQFLTGQIIAVDGGLSLI